jgi:ketosteroid isomerase-like protein
MRLRALPLLATLFALAAGACAAGTKNIPGTRVADTDENRTIIGVVEKYRLAVERKDAPALMAMASKSYWEDGGTPTGSDDYGYDGLREVLTGRFQRADEIRYSLKYLRVRRQGDRAFVDVAIDASYTVKTTRGDERVDKRDQNQIVLEWDGEHWKFISGM